MSNTNTITTAQSPMVESLLSKMTLEEKVGQMNLYNGFYDVTGPAPAGGDARDKYEDIKVGRVGGMLNVNGAAEVRKMQALAVNNSRLGIPMIFGFDVIHGHRTMFPIPIAEVSSWNMDLIKKGARIAAIEASAMGLNWTFAPMVDIGRDPRWGRVMEGAGEDPFLGVAVAKARVNGFQGEDLTANDTVAACTKHFAAYGFAEAGKDYNTTDIGTSTLYNIIFPPFKATIETGVATFMNAFNELNGIPATGDTFLQRDILKDQWNFGGFMVSDWGSIIEMIDHGFARDGKDAARIAANAGSDMDMESHLYVKHLETLVEEGKVKMEVIDDAVRRILMVKEKLGLFEDPYRYCDEKREADLIYHQDHIDASLEMAKESMVLLKNENQFLPLKKSGQKIAVIGQLANSKNSPLGSWRLGAKDNTAISVMEGLEKYPDNDYQYTEGVQLYEGREAFIYDLSINNTDTTGMDEAVALAQESDLVIMVLGEHGYQSGEARTRSDIGLPGLQQELLEKVHAVNSNIVLVTMSGRPLTITWADENIPAILHSWQLGMESGHAIAQALFGDVNPSGKLPMTFPRSVGQIPIYYNHKKTGRPGPKTEVFWSRYIDETNQPLYPFGYGLSYSEFDYSDLKISKNKTTNQVEVSVTIENKSNTTGAEVVQLYIRDRVATVTRPVKELKGFQKITLAPNEKQTVVFSLGDAELGFYDNQGRYIVEEGWFDVMVGGSSEGGLKGEFEYPITP